MIDRDCKYCCSCGVKKRDMLTAKDVIISYSNICGRILSEQGIATIANNVCNISSKIKNIELLKISKCSKHSDYCCYVRDMQNIHDNVATITTQPTKTELEIRRRGRPKNEQKS